MTTIPAAPSLEQLRRRAKDLLRDHCAGDPDARRRVAEHHPDPPEPLKLTAAQLVVAREHGFASYVLECRDADLARSQGMAMP